VVVVVVVDILEEVVDMHSEVEVATLVLLMS